MACSAKFLPIGKSFTLIACSCTSISRSRQLVCAKFKPLKAFANDFGTLYRQSVSKFQFIKFTERKYLNKFCLTRRALIGATVVYGSINFCSRVSLSMNGYDRVVVDDKEDTDEAEEHRRAFWRFAMKLWVPMFFMLTVLASLDYPLRLIVTKVFLFLLSTKPSPLSVYVFVDQLSHHSMSEEPHPCEQKSRYAKKVEVQDYRLLCLAVVEFGGQEFTLLGMLGGWWVLPTLRRCKRIHGQNLFRDFISGN